MNNRTLFGTPVREEARGESGGMSSDVSVGANVEVAARGAAMEGDGLLGAGEAVPPGLKNSPISGCRFGDLRGMPVTSALDGHMVWVWVTWCGYGSHGVAHTHTM
jgi:hypothetical protein